MRKFSLFNEGNRIPHTRLDLAQCRISPISTLDLTPLAGGSEVGDYRQIRSEVGHWGVVQQIHAAV